MLGLSLQKLLVLISIIAAVWYGFKLVSRLDAQRKRSMGAAKPPRKRWRFRDRQPAGKTEEMRPCPACGTYVASGTATGCGRADCPYGSA